MVSLTLELDSNLPTSYRRFTRALDAGKAVEEFSLHGSRAQVFRFANRYRLARAFRSVGLTGYQPPTERAYGALLRILLTCSAAEQYAKITQSAKDLSALEKMISNEDRENCIKQITEFDADSLFFTAVCERTKDPRLADAVRKSLSGELRSLMPLVRSIRHAFAHGDLAPGANGARPGVAQKFAKLVCPVMMEAMDSDFSQRVNLALSTK